MRTWIQVHIYNGPLAIDYQDDYRGDSSICGDGDSSDNRGDDTVGDTDSTMVVVTMLSEKTATVAVTATLMELMELAAATITMTTKTTPTFH